MAGEKSMLRTARNGAEVNRRHLAIFVFPILTLSQGCGFLSSADNAANSDLQLLVCGLTHCPCT